MHLWDSDALAPVWRDASAHSIGYMFVCGMLAVRLCDLISAFRHPLPWQRDLSFRQSILAPASTTQQNSFPPIWYIYIIHLPSSRRLSETYCMCAIVSTQLIPGTVLGPNDTSETAFLPCIVFENHKHDKSKQTDSCMSVICHPTRLLLTILSISIYAGHLMIHLPS